MGKMKVTLVRGLAGRPEDQRLVVRSLGLRKLHQSSILPDNASVRGMVRRVSHLVVVDRVEEKV